MSLPAHAANLLPGPGFEGAFGKNGIAVDWADNSSWADLTVSYARDANNPHSGTACQRIACTRLGWGAVQFVPDRGIPIRKGAIYQVQVWARGDAGALAVQLRRAAAPYTIYMERALTLGPKWQRLQYLWRATVTDPDCRFMLRFTQTGTVWVDDLVVEEITEQQAASMAPPPAHGNLLRNGDFRFGLANWLLAHGCDYWQQATPQVVTEEGQPCLRLTVPAGVSTTLSSDVVPVTPVAGITVSCRLRADREAKVGVGCRRGGRTVQVGKQWLDFTHSWGAGFGRPEHDFVHFSVTGPVTLFLENVQLRQDGKTTGDDRLRAAFTSDRYPMALYHDGEPVHLRLMCVRPAGLAAPRLHWQIEDFWGKIRMSGDWEPPVGYSERPVDASALGRGWFRATVSDQAPGASILNESLFCVLPPAARSGDPAKSPFGAHFAADPTGLALARAVGCRWLRLHPPNYTKWRTVEPEKGQWHWPDQAIRAVRRAGIDILGSLDRLPRWASTAPPNASNAYYTGFSAWMPRDWSDWETYVAQTVQHYKHDIHIWEVWNEPNGRDWLIPRPGQTKAEAYVEILRHTYPIVKRVDPSAQVIGGCVAGAPTEKSSAWRFTQDIIHLGALSFMDIFSFHQYISQPVDEGGEPLQVWLPRLRAAMKAAGKVVPIINSEGGFGDPGTAITYRPCESATISPEKMARWLVRQYVSQLSLGIQKFFFYNFFIDGSPVPRLWEGFVEGDGQPRPNVAAYATMTWLLDGASFVRTERPSSDTWLHYFTTPRGPLVVAWNRTGTTTRLSFPTANAAWDLMGAPLRLSPDRRLTVSDAPVYVLLKR